MASSILVMVSFFDISLGINHKNIKIQEAISKLVKSILINNWCNVKNSTRNMATI
jgi:hypothetical protein